ncbi:hypothetical protein Vadar_006010 [Vaccinium darrowii]|uniref:Uncharacterized protein n=1 Tax=Vaccinium darrowii TaxID=229202 RepID=A0ACB7YTB6_9ERIC|nr:hypothetical protein Vadar_006010 [Vaccinium darrowii]
MATSFHFCKDLRGWVRASEAYSPLRLTSHLTSQRVWEDSPIHHIVFATPLAWPEVTFSGTWLPATTRRPTSHPMCQASVMLCSAKSLGTNRLGCRWNTTEPIDLASLLNPLVALADGTSSERIGLECSPQQWEFRPPLEQPLPTTEAIQPRLNCLDLPYRWVNPLKLGSACRQRRTFWYEAKFIQEIVGAIKRMLGGDHLRVADHQELDKNMKTLKREVMYLSAQEDDITKQINSAEHLPWRRRKTEVEVWLRDVQRLKNDVQRLEEEVDGERNFFSRLWLGKRIIEKIKEVEKLQEKGRAFNDLLVDQFPTGKLSMPLTEDFVDSTKARNVERVWECLMNGEDRRIGVFGMGGVGKTTIMKHIHNRLLEKTDMFDAVFWVTVSKFFNIINLQSNIAKELNFSLLDDKDVTRRAKQLHAVLCQQKRYVLIIDDLWEVFLLEGVGIPKPTGSNGCKLVLTTRSLEVCKGMRCKTIKVELLTEQEALTLFLCKVVEDVMVLSPEVKEIATQIAKECACLPLAIVTVAGNLQGLEGTCEWRNALTELISSTKDASNCESVVFEQLKFSYSRLGNEILQNCFLCCFLYPEDHYIPVEELIEYWIAEELISDMNSIEEQFDKGHAILAKLTNSSLLESFIDKSGDYFIQIHDLIRDMAIKITQSSPRFMVKAGESIGSLAYEHWSEDLERISFMGSWINELPIAPPVCPRLTTLLLNGIHLKEIPDSFFSNMLGLEVLDLSSNYEIESLPESISNLENLRALILDRCHELNYVPSLEKLKALKVFTLTLSRIEKVPEGIEELVNLTKLDLSNNFNLGNFPTCKLCRFSKLRFLRMDGTKAKVSADDLLCLRELEVVAVHFHNVQELTRYATSQHWQGLEKYWLLVGERKREKSKINEKEVCIFSKSKPLVSGVNQLVLPANMDFFQLDGFDNVVNLSSISTLKGARNLRSFNVRSGNGLETIFSSSSFSENGQIFLGTVEELHLALLPNYRVLFDGIAPPPNISFNLKKLFFYGCHIMKNIFPVQLLRNFPNLETLQVWDCENVEDIIVKMSDWGNHQDDSYIISLPKLKILILAGLSRLKSIYNGVMVCQSIEKVTVANCPMLRRLPLSLQMDSQQATAPPSLKLIKVDEELWESLEWDDPFTKTILQPFLNRAIRWL